MVPDVEKNYIPVFLQPFYSLYAELSHRRVEYYKRSAVRLEIPVISVGNITLGGTAKTPTSELIARMLVENGFNPGIVLRGYRGRIDRENRKPEIVSDGRGILLDWTDSGDEASLIASNFIRDSIPVPVCVGRDRIFATKLLMQKCGVDVAILDDGYQYSSLSRDLDLVLVDCLLPFGMPSLSNGILREPLKALARADAIILTHAEAVGAGRLDAIRDRLKDRVNPLPPIFTARTMIRHTRDFNSGHTVQTEPEPTRKLIGFSGIGNPGSFGFTLESLGHSLAGMLHFPDHHIYTLKDIVRIKSMLADTGATAAYTTAKDAVRLVELREHMNFDLRVLDIEVETENNARFTELILRKITASALPVKARRAG